MFFFPFVFIYFLFFLLFLIIFFFLIHIGAITFAFERIGIAPKYVFSLLLFTLLGSYINIPIKSIKSEIYIPEREIITFFGIRYHPPTIQLEETKLAVNVGGCVIPTLISIALLFKFDHLLQASLATLFVSLVTNRFAKPIRGVGIAVPTFIPPLCAALCGWVFGGALAPQIAYISGTLGTLIGADLLNLKAIGELGAPVASIGGAGTFDGVFLTGIIAVLLV